MKKLIFLFLCFLTVNAYSQSNSSRRITIQGVLLDNVTADYPYCGYVITNATLRFQVVNSSDVTLVGDTITASFRCPRESFGSNYFVNRMGMQYSFVVSEPPPPIKSEVIRSFPPVYEVVGLY